MFNNSGNGRNRKNLGLGVQGNCVCESCGYAAPHGRGVPCYEVTCPNCGSFLKREEISKKNTSKLQVNEETCLGCGRCISICPVGAISMFGNKAVIDPSACAGCRKCISVCPADAIK